MTADEESSKVIHDGHVATQASASNWAHKHGSGFLVENSRQQQANAMPHRSSDSKTLAVQKWYSEFPYPPPWANRWVRWRESRKLLNKGTRAAKAMLRIDPTLQKGRFLDVGSGTGLRLIGMARTLPEATFLGLELSPESVKLATENLRRYGVSNVELRQIDFFREELLEPFDAVLSSGVIHHLSDPDSGLKKLIGAVKSRGHIYLVVYGKYGRQNIRRYQEAVDFLESDPAKTKERLVILRSFLHGQYKAMLRDDAYTLDYFLHIQERHYEIAELFEQFKAAGAEIVEWLRFDRRLAKHVVDADVRAQILKLDQKARYRVLELLHRPNLLHVVGRRL